MRIEADANAVAAYVKPEPPPPPPPRTTREDEAPGAASKVGQQDQQATLLRARLFEQESLANTTLFGTATVNAARAGGVTAQPGPQATRAYWEREALRSAGINPAAWDPSQGFGANAGNVNRVYEYYTRLYNNHPELQWAGMAKLAGGTVLGGLEEIYAIRNAARVGAVIPGPLQPLANLAEGDLGFLENKLLEMQKAIFNDLAWQHEAYARGGIQTMRDLHANGQLSNAELNVWEDIASGNQARIERGNEALLLREQRDILTPYYNQINSHGFLGIEGKAMSVALSLLAESPVPGGRAFRDVVHREVFGIDTGIPGDITNFNDRWEWIKNDMLPRWQAMNRNNPQQARNLVNTPLQDLANRNLLKQGETILRFVLEVLPPHLRIPPVIP